ncbi:hypothetical protein LguiA_014254 [Lonicera macranthoides]
MGNKKDKMLLLINARLILEGESCWVLNLKRERNEIKGAFDCEYEICMERK